MRMRPTVALVSVLSLAGSLSAAAQADAAAKRHAKHQTTRAVRAKGSTAPSWTPPLALGGGGGEPSIRTAPDGKAAAYVAAPSGLGSNFWRIDEQRSGGYTRMVSAPVKQPDLGTGGGDAEISVGTAVDPATGCAPIAYSGLHNIDLLDNFTTSYSSDCGKTFSTPNVYATQNTLTDRQWQAFDGVKTNHLIYHKVDTGQIVDSVSYDGGRTYVTLGTAAGATGVIDPQHLYTQQNVKIGNIVVDQSHVEEANYPISGERIHRLYAVFAGARDAADAVAAQTDGNVPGTPQFDHLDTIYLARSDDGGLSWTDTQAYTTPVGSTRELDLVFPVVTVDKVGNVYAGWTDGNQIQYEASRDGGATWSSPYLVNPGEPGARKANGSADIFPWMQAGANGALDLVWYHATGGDTTGYRLVGDKNTAWTVAFAQLANAAAPAGRTPKPTVLSRSLAITPVMHRGNVCNDGTVCDLPAAGKGGDRTLLDFFQVAVDNAGRANIAYASDVATPGTSGIFYTRQNAGNSLWTGRPVPRLAFAGGIPQLGTSCPGPQVVDPAGDAPATLTVGTPTTNVDSLDLVGVALHQPNRSTLRVSLTINNLSTLPPGGATTGSMYEATWNGQGRDGKAHTWYARAESNGPGLQRYDSGELVGGKEVPASTAPTGTFTEGANGVVRIDVPLAAVGSPAQGSTLSGLAARTYGTVREQGRGAYWSAAVDKAPKNGTAAPYVLGRC